MNNRIEILMIDDHPAIIEGYGSILLNNSKLDLKITPSYSFDEALRLIRKSINKKTYDIVFLDLKLPPSSDSKITTGEEFSVLIRKLLPDSKIMILTMFENRSRLVNILKNVPHNGLLVKSDVNAEVLTKAVEKVLNNDIYYSERVNLLRDKNINSTIMLDSIDIKILNHISEGIKTKELVHYIDLSLSAIEKRKYNLKIQFNVENDLKLISKAKDEGFI